MYFLRLKPKKSLSTSHSRGKVAKKRFNYEQVEDAHSTGENLNPGNIRLQCRVFAFCKN